MLRPASFEKRNIGVRSGIESWLSNTNWEDNHDNRHIMVPLEY